MNETMYIYLYANRSSDRDLIDPAREALETATSQTINHFSNSGEKIGRVIEEVPDEPNIAIDSESSPFEIGGEFNQFLMRQEGGKRTGEHLLLTRGGGGGVAVPVFGGAWQNSPVSVVTLRTDQGLQYFKSLCVHEVYHNFITTGPVLASDHQLGYVDPDTGKQTPMLNGYIGEGPGTAGDCSNTANDARYTLELSSCALDATLTTYREQGNIF